MNTINSTLTSKTYIPFKTVGIERIRVTENGLFGIGTTEPKTLFDVNGNIKIRNTLNMVNNNIINIKNLKINNDTSSSYVVDISGGISSISNDITLKTMILNNETTLSRPVETSVGILRYNSSFDSFEGYTSEWVDIGYYSGLPLGAIIIDSSNVVPSTSFLLCDGSEISRIIYSDLFSLIGTTYGIGNGSSTFNLPNLKGKILVGCDSSDLSFNYIGLIGGINKCKLNPSNIPNHTHGLSGTIQGQFQGSLTTTDISGSHTHAITETGHTHKFNSKMITQVGYYSTDQQQSTNAAYANWSGNTTSHAVSNPVFDTSPSHSHTFLPSGNIIIQNTLNILTSGSDNSHNNVQPYIVLNYFIKANKTPKKYNSYVSDERIKKNITDINTKEALDIILKIHPKKYNLIDNNSSFFNSEYGFIAQELLNIFNDCIYLDKGFIPNIFSYTNKIIKYDNYSTIFMSNKILFKNSNIRLKVINNKKKSFIVNCFEVLDDYSFKINELLDDDEYFIYGQEVDDFHYINKNYIYTLIFSAIKEMDKKYTELFNNVHKQLQTQLYKINN